MKVKRRAVRVWSKDDVKSLRALAKARLSGTQAAKKLRRTRGAVAQKAMTLGIRFRFHQSRSSLGFRVKASVGAGRFP